MTRKPYPTDLTDDQWAHLEPLLPKPKSGTRKGGRPATDLREVVNAIAHHLRAGSAWRLLPHDFPPWQTVYGYFRGWRGVGERPRPAAGGCPGRRRGPADPGDVAGRQPDRDAGCWLLGAIRGRLARVREVIADAGFTKRFIDWVRRVCGWRVTTTHNAPEGFKIHPRRWVVERTFAWFGKYRRLAKDHEYTIESSEAMIYVAMIHRMLRRLHPSP